VPEMNIAEQNAMLRKQSPSPVPAVNLCEKLNSDMKSILILYGSPDITSAYQIGATFPTFGD
jgi:hypothetical protein